MSGHSFKVFRGSPSGEIIETITETPALIGDQVLLNLTHSGVCGTDEHFVKAGIALGHEGVGTVKELGPDVKLLKVGDRVGWGYMNGGACGTCRSCLDGYQIMCEGEGAGRYGEGFHDSGSFAESAVRSESYLFRIPDGLASSTAAPLMCGGITVWAALDMGGVKPFETVGVVGIGGLGHLAIQFAKAMGCTVVVFSTTDSKKEQAIKLGATHFVTTKDKTELSCPVKIDHLLVTASRSPDWSLFMPIMAARSSIYPLTLPDFTAKLDIPHIWVLMKGLRILSTMPKKSSYADMLAFVARNKIEVVVDRDDLSKDGITKSLQKLRVGNTRYRGVLFAAGEV